MADITEDMIERGAQALAGTDDVQQWRWAAEEVLSAALEGYAIAPLGGVAGNALREGESDE